MPCLRRNAPSHKAALTENAITQAEWQEKKGAGGNGKRGSAEGHPSRRRLQGKSCSWRRKRSAQAVKGWGQMRRGFAEKETAEVAFKQEMVLLAEKQRRIDEAEALRPEKEGLQERIAKSQSRLGSIAERAEETNTALRQKQGEYGLLQAQLGNLTAAVLTEKCAALQKEISLAEKKESDLQETLQQTREKKEARFLALRKQAEQEESSRRKRRSRRRKQNFCRFTGKRALQIRQNMKHISQSARHWSVRRKKKTGSFRRFGKAKQLAEMLAESCAKKGAEGCFRFGGGAKNAFDGTRGEKADGR